MMEVLRTSLGFAGARDPGRRIADAAALGRYQDAAVRLARTCLVGRHAADGGGAAGVGAAHEVMMRALREVDVDALRGEAVGEAVEAAQGRE